MVRVKNWRRKKRKRRKKTPKQLADDRCLDLWRQMVRKNAGLWCEWCGKLAVECHHMVGCGRNVYLRFNPRNGTFLCKGCHINFHTKESQTGWDLFEEQRPEDNDFVKEHKHQTTTKTLAFLEGIEAGLKHMLEENNEG